MGFDIYKIQPLKNNLIALRRLRSLPMGGTDGFLAQHVPLLAARGDHWSLTAQELLRLAGEKEIESKGVFFNLTPSSTDQANLFQLLSVSGRTMSMLTDALFHFKVACASRNRAALTGDEGELIVSDWSHRPVRLEQLRLEGGTRGGTWAWSEPPQGASATVV